MAKKILVQIGNKFFTLKLHKTAKNFKDVNKILDEYEVRLLRDREE